VEVLRLWAGKFEMKRMYPNIIPIFEDFLNMVTVTEKSRLENPGVGFSTLRVIKLQIFVFTSQVIATEIPPNPLQIKNIDSLSFHEIPIEELSRQFCLFDSKSLKQIPYNEFNNLAWVRYNAPNMSNFINRSNRVTRYH
jgi:hypothetical protein